MFDPAPGIGFGFELGDWSDSLTLFRVAAVAWPKFMLPAGSVPGVIAHRLPALIWCPKTRGNSSGMQCEENEQSSRKAQAIRLSERPEKS
jgi:hypothetical protein